MTKIEQLEVARSRMEAEGLSVAYLVSSLLVHKSNAYDFQAYLEAKIKVFNEFHRKYNELLDESVAEWKEANGAK